MSTTLCFAFYMATQNCLYLFEDESVSDLDSSDNKVALKLFAFCQSSLLHDRGLACSALAGTSDQWIFERLIDNRQFKVALSKSEPTAQYLDEKAMKSRPNVLEDEYDGDLPPCMVDDGFRDELVKKLTAGEMERLPGVYLRLEGLMALCRPDFGHLFDDKKKQDEIVAIVTKVFVERASPIYRRIFAGRIPDDEFSIYHADLRRVSVELDEQILKILSEQEQGKLWQILLDSKSLDGNISGPGPR